MWLYGPNTATQLEWREFHQGNYVRTASRNDRTFRMVNYYNSYNSSLIQMIFPCLLVKSPWPLSPTGPGGRRALHPERATTYPSGDGDAHRFGCVSMYISEINASGNKTMNMMATSIIVIVIVIAIAILLLISIISGIILILWSLWRLW